MSTSKNKIGDLVMFNRVLGYIKKQNTNGMYVVQWLRSLWDPTNTIHCSESTETHEDIVRMKRTLNVYLQKSQG